VEKRYISTLSLTSVLDGVGAQRHDRATLPSGKTRYPLYRGLGGPQDQSGWVQKQGVIKMYINLHVKYPLLQSDFNTTRILLERLLINLHL
jgi:hypothetical protein